MMHDLVSVEQLTPAAVSHYVQLAQTFKKGAQIQLVHPVYAMNLFFEIVRGLIPVLKWPSGDWGLKF